ncbi:MAG: hypothetical protein A2086_12490 [Spirochaetes bacterium GWD1_27_9]|nr:MAG: hypothetical protein A2Z98_11915 [Spirochaetes bacterium GWB1_27_13]OHD28180.1 MAG: hypothetical protein A2Y34_07230 [Spirochaetes bacterium GWC1_27_15]OHD44278.1 MAG: hypothetical protein A2086_12490 [Spirochaetes bacterium GWD1_27_9]
MKFKLLIVVLLQIIILTSCARFVLEDKEFSVYETEHFVFFCQPDSKMEKDIQKIASYSEKGFAFFNDFMDTNINIKIDTYLFDSQDSTSYSKLLKSLNYEFDFPAFTDLNGTIYLCYDYVDFDYSLASEVVLHEATHVIQNTFLYIFAPGIYEGHAEFMELKFGLYKNNGYSSESTIFSNLQPQIKNIVLKKNEMPSFIFGLNFAEFQGLSINDFKRETGYRYDIGASFIAFIIDKYDIKKLKNWFYKTNKDNFKQNFKNSYGVDFDTEEKNWYNLLMKE